MNMKASSPGGPKRIQISNLFKSSVKEVFVLFVHKIDIFSTERDMREVFFARKQCCIDFNF